MNAAEWKSALRREARSRIAALGEGERRAAAEAICSRLHERLGELGANQLLAFHPSPREVDIRPLLREWLAAGDRWLLLPRVEEAGMLLRCYRVNDLSLLAPGFKGLLEPDPLRCEAVPPPMVEGAVLVPGLLFGPGGARLGQGGGHYDRLLAELPQGVRRIGAGFAFQLTEEAIPCEAHDQRVEEVVTPEGVRVFSGGEGGNKTPPSAGAESGVGGS